MKKALFCLIVLLLILLAVWLAWKRNAPSEERPETPSPSLSVEVFFGSSEKDPEGSQCDQVYPVSRRLPPTQAVGRMALEELLKGPTEKETEEGYFSSIDPGLSLSGLRIEKGVAYVDFSSSQDSPVAGSCQVEAIRAQIFQTLQQFESIQDVVISVNGKIDEAFQP